MKKNIIFFLSALVFVFMNANAQTYVLDESLLTQTSFNRFIPVSITGGQNWYFSTYGATMSGFYNSRSNANEDWLISPEIDLSNMNSSKLSFDHTRGPAGSMNVGVTEGWYKVFATADYTGDVATTVWAEITDVNHVITSAWNFVSSDQLAIPASAVSATTRIAFRYFCDDNQSATWEIQKVKVFGTLRTETIDFKVTTWNVEWLSCSDNAPYNTELQINNVVSVIKTMDSDLVALQEVGTSNIYTTIDTLVRRLGNEWGGNIAPWSNTNCDQNQGIVYKKSKVKIANFSLITNGGSYNSWSSGRYPALYNVNLVLDDEEIPISLVNIHAKAFSDASSYARRKEASIGLKNLLDGSMYRDKRLVITGDFNDYLIGSQYDNSGSDSPYKNFMDDSENYRGLTENLINPWYGNPVIDNVIISNELFDNYNPAATIQEIPATQTIANYRNTTSGHIPVSVALRFKNSSNIYPILPAASIAMYPNPTTGIFTIFGENLSENDRIELFSVTGLLLKTYAVHSAETTIDLTGYSSGFYIVKVKDKVGKILKR